MVLAIQKERGKGERLGFAAEGSGFVCMGFVGFDP